VDYTCCGLRLFNLSTFWFFVVPMMNTSILTLRLSPISYFWYFMYPMFVHCDTYELEITITLSLYLFLMDIWILMDSLCMV
jgi:hypothetical protein